MKKSDLIELSGWEKGEGGYFGVKGKGSNGVDYAYENKDVFFRREDGWTRMRMLYSTFAECDSSDITFYTGSKSNSPVYFDDVKYKVVRLRGH